MQRLESNLIEEVKKLKMKKLEKSFEGFEEGMNLCPLCSYQGKYSPKGSLKVFKNGTAKCFSCGIWRQM